MKQFLFIDDHAVVRSTFTKILSEPFKPVEVEEASNGEEAMKKVKEKKFDLVIMDIQMPDTNTLELIQYIKNKSSQTKILMLTMAPENIHASHYLKAGADGYASKESSLEEVTRAMDTILRGKKYISNALADSFAETLFNKKKITNNPFENLSKKEYEVAMLLLQGKPIADIATSLNAAASTIGTYKSRILTKLKITNILELKELATLHNL